jgi:hypothetical protein
MNEDFLYAQNASEQADRAEYWARKAEKAANQIDIPALMLITIACSLLLTCLVVTIAQSQTLHQIEVRYAQCKR